MRQILLSISFLLVANFGLQAQHLICGNSPTSEGAAEHRNRLLHNVRMAAEGTFSARDISYVPIRFHIGARANGSGRLNENKIFDQLCELNEDYLEYNIQFFLADGYFNYINNTTFYENHGATQSSIMNLEKDNRAINVYIVENADPDPQPDGVTLAYYSPNRDWIVITKTYIDKDDATLSHEIGHFFSLSHTFYGFEAEPYNTENVPAPNFSSLGIATERVNGTNCEVAGDAICDTPPDYNNGTGFSGCNFNRNVLDPQGTQIDPDESNYLSYFLSCPDDEYHFSPIQEEVIHQDLNSFQRNYLRINPVPDYVAIEDTPTAISPINNEMTPGYNQVQLQWTGVAGANAYLLEYSRVSTFTVDPVRLLVYGTSKIIEDLSQDSRYYWRVRPVNSHYGCAPTSDTESFTTSTIVSTQELSFVESFRVSPNPVSGQQQVDIRLNSAEAFVAQIQLLDITGRPVNAGIQHNFGTGAQQLSLPIGNLSNGIYILQVNTNKGQLTDKIVVAN